MAPDMVTWEPDFGPPFVSRFSRLLLFGSLHMKRLTPSFSGPTTVVPPKARQPTGLGVTGRPHVGGRHGCHELARELRVGPGVLLHSSSAASAPARDVPLSERLVVLQDILETRGLKKHKCHKRTRIVLLMGSQCPHELKCTASLAWGDLGGS